MRQLYKDHLDPFIKSGGKAWADRLRDSCSTPAALDGLVASLNLVSEVSISNYYRNDAWHRSRTNILSIDEIHGRERSE